MLLCPCCKRSASSGSSPQGSPSAAASSGPAKVAAAASAAAEALDLSTGPTERQDPARAVGLYKQACDDGNADGCAGLGIEYTWNMLGVKLDVADGAALLKRACDAGSFRGCNALGNATEEGKGLPKSEDQARELFQRACDGGDRRGCRNLAGYLMDGRGGLPKSIDRANTLLGKACQMGDTTACAKLGLSTFKGEGVSRSCAKAMELLEKACFDERDPMGFACGDAYLIVSRGGCDGHKDVKAAERYARRGCDVDKQECDRLASVYLGGQGVPADPKKAIELLQESCAHDSSDGCIEDEDRSTSWRRDVCVPSRPNFNNRVAPARGAIPHGDGCVALGDPFWGRTRVLRPLRGSPAH
jgi:TPR repeat protein